MMPENKTQAQFDYERKHEEDLQRIRGFRLLDDDFMSKVFEDHACTEFLLQIILQRDDLTVVEVKTQYTIQSVHGRSVRLDIRAKDTIGRFYDIEIQRSDRGAVAKRARYNSSLLDTDITDPGDSYEALAETYVIFITESDVIGKNLPIYHIDRVIKETGDDFGDGEHIIYVNSQIKEDTALGKLMHDFSCTNAKDMNYKVLADRVSYFKDNTEGVATMCKVMEDMRNETAKETEKRTTMQIALRALAKGFSIPDVAEMCKLSVEEVTKLSQQPA